MARSCRWTPLGPIGLITDQEDPGKSVMSGRVTSIATHPTDPNVVYIGTAGGGVWGTTDGGETWRPLTDQGWCLSIGAIAIDPSKPDRVYAGTGEWNDTTMGFDGEGLLVREDSDSAWQRIPLPVDPGSELRVSDLVVSSGGDRIFVATTAGLFRRQRVGATWSLTRVTDDHYTSLAFDEASDRLYAGSANGRVFVVAGSAAPTALGMSAADSSKRLPDPSKMKDGASLGRVALAWSRSEPSVLFAAIAGERPRNDDPLLKAQHLFGIFRSDDSGETWNTVASAGPAFATAALTDIFGEPQATYNLAFARDPNDTRVLFLGLVSLRRSSNGGQGWVVVAGSPREGDERELDEAESTAEGPATTASSTSEAESVHEDQHAIAFGPLQAAHSGGDASSRTVWLGNDGGIWRSDDGGSTWSHRNRGLATMQFYGGAAHRHFSALCIAGAQDNGVQVYEGHPVWRRVGGGDGGPARIDSLDERWWRTSLGSDIRYSDHLSGKWKIVVIPKPASRFAVLTLAPSDPSIVYVGAQRLYRAFIRRHPSVFEIPEYFDQGGTTVRALAVAAADPRIVYVADDGDRVFRIDADPLSPEVTPLPDLQLIPPQAVSAIAVSPRDPSRVYVTIGDLGNNSPHFEASRLFRLRSNDTWEDLTGGLPDFVSGDVTREARKNAVNAIAIDPDPAITSVAHERIVIGCDLGVLLSPDGGDSWQSISHGLPLTPVFELTFQRSDRRVRAFTHGRSTWERDADLPPCTNGSHPTKEVDLYLRDYRYDAGLRDTEDSLDDPVDRDQATLRWSDASDLMFDREAVAGEDDSDNREDDEDQEQRSGFQRAASTIDYSSTGALDCIGFEALTHREPRKGAKARAYLQVHNRGPDSATAVTARLYYAAMNSGGSWPDLPADFWTTFPAADPAAGSSWTPIGPAKTVPEIRPAEPEVLMWEWDVPQDLADVIGILAVVTSTDDPVFEGTAPAAMPRAIEPLVRGNKHMSLKKTHTIAAKTSGCWDKVKTVAEYLGIALLAGAAVYGLYEGGEYVKSKLEH